jgi:hypothetical protein
MRTFNEAAALELMRSGQCLVRTNTRSGAKWFLGGGQVTSKTAERLITRSDVEQFDPGLFPDPALAQSFSLRRSLSHA